MQIFESRYARLNGKIYLDLVRDAREIYNQIVRRTKRNPYVRSKYFKNSKVFLNVFWNHLAQKNPSDRKRRLRFFPCAIDLLRNTTYEPDMVLNPNKTSEILYRFHGKSADGASFTVQVKRDNRSDNKFFMSVFPD